MLFLSRVSSCVSYSNTVATVANSLVYTTLLPVFEQGDDFFHTSYCTVKSPTIRIIALDVQLHPWRVCEDMAGNLATEGATI